jgi:hypothetical protein
VIQTISATLARRFGDPGMCVTVMHLEDGTKIIGKIDGHDHTTLYYSDGTTVELTNVKSIGEIFKAAKRTIQQPITSLDMELHLAEKVYRRHLPGPPTNPELLTMAYRDIVKEILSA